MFKRLLMLGLLLPMVMAITHVWADDDDFLRADEAFKPSLTVTDGKIDVHWKIAEGYFLYRDKFRVESETDELILGEMVYPPSETRSDPNFGETEVYHHDVTLTAPVRSGGGDSTIKLIYQGCADSGLCYPPQKVALKTGKILSKVRREGVLQTPAGITNAITHGVVEYSLTLIKGWTFEQALSAVRSHPMIVQTMTNLSNEQIMVRLGYPGLFPEGWFLPGTYTFPKGSSDALILKSACQQMERVLAEEWRHRANGLPLKTPYEALTLASIVEKENGAIDEYEQIAGVFTRRLQKGMFLQTDPTVIYGMGDADDGRIRRKDLTADTPYNTYLHAGLTPTPIALPGREAIHAALHPADGNVLYFAETGKGGHYFSATLQEHNQAVQKHLIQRNNQ